MDTAISAGVLAPMRRPTGPCRRASSASVRSKCSASRFLRAGLVARRAERADVEGVGTQRLQQRHVVELGVVRQRDDGRVRVGPQLAHRRRRACPGTCVAPGPPASCRSTPRAGRTPAPRNRACCAICATACDSWPAPTSSRRHFGPNSVVSFDAVELACAARASAAASVTSPLASVSVRATSSCAAVRASSSSTQRGIAQRLLHQPQRAAARQAEARGLFLAHAVGDHRRRAGALAGLHARDQVVLDAAARHRAAHHAVVAHGQQRARRPRRAAPGLDHRDQRHRVAGAAPGQCIGQHAQVQAFHIRALLRGVCQRATTVLRFWPRCENAPMSTTSARLAQLRKSYERAGLSEEASHADPLQQFEQWLAEAISAELPEPNAMTLATVGEQPAPQHPRGADQGLRRARHRLVHQLRKPQGPGARRQSATPPCSSTGWSWSGWCASRAGSRRPAPPRATPTSPRRPLDSRIGAWASPQSQVIASRGVLVANAAKYRRAVPAPSAAPAALGRLPAGARPLGVLAGPQEPAARPAALPAGCGRLGARAPRALKLQPRGAGQHQRHGAERQYRGQSHARRDQVLGHPTATRCSSAAAAKPPRWATTGPCLTTRANPLFPSSRSPAPPAC